MEHHCVICLCSHRLAAQAQNLKKAEGPKKLYVGSLHYNINEMMLKAIFEPFGSVEKIQIMKDEAGLSKGYAFVEVSSISDKKGEILLYILCYTCVLHVYSLMTRSVQSGP